MIHVIGFYPGAGGNRYLRSINGLEFSTHNIAYDNRVTNQYLENRYLLGKTISTSDVILTHCVNESHIRSMIPECNITIIVSDLKKSLHREWKLLGHDRHKFNYTSIEIRLEHYNAIKAISWPEITNEQEFLSLPEHIKNEVDTMYANMYNALGPDSDYQYLQTAFDTIGWHHNYYSQYPLHYTQACVINIDQDNSEFSQVMQKELNSKIDPMFELAWDSYYKFGADARITEIYEQYKK